MKRWPTLLLLLTCCGLAEAGVLYRWVDASGQTRFGYRPPPGVQAELADDNARTGAGCRDLAQAHLQLVDREIARVKAAPAGLGLAYEFTPETRQRLLNDLLAHRAALVTGRPAAEFAPPDPQREFERSKMQFERERSALRTELADQERRAQKLREELRRPPVNLFIRGWQWGWRRW